MSPCWNRRLYTTIGLALALGTSVALSACMSRRRPAESNRPPDPPTAAVPPAPALPAFLLGDFQDDYGARFTISPEDFFQRSRNHYRIVRWDVANQYLIAQNDSANPSAPNKWTRIDWLKLNGMPPFEWAFCFSAYQANTRAEAEATRIAKRDTPLTGCNGFPFTRMKRAS